MHSCVSICPNIWKAHVRLIGSPPGRRRHDEAGQLTEKIRRRPYSVVLLTRSRRRTRMCSIPAADSG
ncbi:MAG: AAA family ATPase [Butyricicoccus sp.]